MQSSRRKTWKDKIDPAFDSTVKTYVGFLENCEEMPDSGISLNDELKKTVINNPGWHGAYVEDRPPDEVIQFVKNTGVMDDDILGVFHYTEESNKDYFDKCLKIAEGLPEESKSFYAKEIQSLVNDSSIKPPFSLFETPGRNNMDFYSVIASLCMRHIFIRLGETRHAEVSDKEVEAFKKSDVINYFMGTVYSALTSVAYQRTLRNLLIKFREGDDRSLFRAITIDKTLLFCKEVRERIMEAQVSGDRGFFKELGKAISTDPNKDLKAPGKLFPVLIFFWPFGLYRLSRPELHDLLVQSDVISRHYSPDALEKFLQRFILPYFPK